MTEMRRWLIGRAGSNMIFVFFYPAAHGSAQYVVEWFDGVSYHPHTMHRTKSVAFRSARALFKRVRSVRTQPLP